MTRWLVVGGGSAGCVIAARLSQDVSNDVTLLEAGSDHGASAGAPGEPVIVDPDVLRPPIEIVRRPGASPVPYVRGVGLGGSSLVNASVVVGDVERESVGHDLPLQAADPLGAVARAAIDATSDAAPVLLVARAGRRVSAADAYVRPVRERPNLSVVTRTAVDRVVFDGRRAAGVVTDTGVELVADRVVLCAGPIGTPTVLLRSHVDTPGVGDGLQDHAGVAFSFDLAAPALTETVAIGATVERPGRQIVLMDRLPGQPEMGAAIAGHLEVTSIGRVTLPDPGGAAVVELRQLASASDLDGLAFVAGEALALLATPEVRSVIGRVFIDEHGTGPDGLRTADAMRAWLVAHLGGYHHLAGSCREGVVTRGGALHGYEGVFVADASGLRGPSRRNPYLTVIRHAEAVARRLLVG